MNTGCSGISNPVFINPMPDLSLFPSCCDTLCDTTTKVIVPPLPLAVGQNACTVYNIVWLNNGVPISPQPSPCNALPIASLGLGQHNISIAVTLNGCTDTSKVFSLFIKKCNCDCKGSHWGDITLTPGETPPPKTAGNKGKANITAPIKLACNQGITITDCSKPYTFNATYICADTACAANVTYSLQPPTGPAITGTAPLTYNFTQNGVYILTLYGWCDGKKCDSCTIDITVNCATDCCKGSTWKDVPWYYFEGPATPQPIKLDCAKEPVITITDGNCKKPLVVGSLISCPPNCISADSVFVYDNTNAVVLSGPAPLTITGLANGVYTIVFNGYCGGKLCLTCKAILKIDCPPEPGCDCKGSNWVETFVTTGGSSKPFNCKNPKTFDVKCNQPVTVNAMYNCAGANCPGTVNYSLQPPSGPAITGSMPPAFTFTPTQSGVYTLTLVGFCGGKECDKCVVTFKTECPPQPCCPEPIKITPGTPVYTASTSPAATIVANNFNISGLGSKNIVEVRANVISYTITDNFNKECMRCVNQPFTWASMASANNIGTAAPMITMFGGTSVPSFSGSGPGSYQNPREIVWNNGSNLNSPPLTNIGIRFILPPAPGIDCCELKGKICIKFTFRDKDCKECEAIGCFEFVIKKK
ncbi:MAG: hypothetical protein JNM68_06180 [Dinghuibacter sp.]|nr:hypothetical protein [Dinghuibacter sp.]